MRWLGTVVRWPWTWLAATIALAPVWLILLNAWGQANEKVLRLSSPRASCVPVSQGGFNCIQTARAGDRDLVWAIVLIVLSLVCLGIGLALFRPKRQHVF